MNYPAFRAVKRTSPIDGGNMNRVFPGRPDGGVTEKIADYFQRVILPMADPLARVHGVERTGGAPVGYRAKRDGLFIGRHFPGLIALGDPVAVIGVPV